MKIGILSDTHGYLDPKLIDFFNDCDEIWHAGDIGDAKVCAELSKHKPLISVYGNIDGTEIRSQFPEIEERTREGLRIMMIHIGGYPGRYDRRIRERLKANPPDIFISGHSHILKVIPDKELDLLHINPGAAGYHGLHQVRTAVRFEIKNSHIQNLEVIELGPRSVHEKAPSHKD
ncbi:metallophosphoesterase family protein [Bacteroidota bacterium]